MKLFLDIENYTVSTKHSEKNNFEINIEFGAKCTRVMRVAEDFLIQYCKNKILYKLYALSKTTVLFLTKDLKERESIIWHELSASMIHFHIRDLFKRILQNNFSASVEFGASNDDVTHVNKSFRSFESRFSVERTEKILQRLNQAQENSNFADCIICSQVLPVELLASTQMNNVTRLALFYTQCNALPVAFYSILNSPLTNVVMSLRDLTDPILERLTIKLSDPMCRIKRARIDIKESLPEQLISIATSLRTNKSVESLRIRCEGNYSYQKASMRKGVKSMPNLFQWALVEHDFIRSISIRRVISYDNILVLCEKVTEICKFNCFIQSKEFLQTCMIFFSAQVPPYVLLEFFRYLFPILSFKANDEVERKLNRVVIPKILMIYQSCRNVKDN